MEYRSFTPDIEVRSVGNKRLLCGIVVPYGVNQRIDESLVERFESGAFSHQFRAANRVRLLNQHSRDPGHMQLGHGQEFRDDPAGLYGEFRVVDSPMGDHFLALAREGSIRQWSIGFESLAERMDGRTTVRTKARMFETALVPEGAYGDLAAVGAVRSALPTLARDTLLARLPKPHFPA
jgi:Escherichia/Staphylococcus phage prohead protease